MTEVLEVTNGISPFTRQMDWFDPLQHQDARVTIVGVGGIGSPAAMALAKLGIPSLTLVDHDTVEAHNTPNQMFDLASIGQPKVDAMAERIKDMGLTGEIITVPTKLEEVHRYSGIVVSGLDSMEARAELWKKLKHATSVSLLIDARLGGQSIVMYCVRPLIDGRAYEETLHSDEEGMELPCTGRGIIDVGFTVASLVTRAVRQHLAGRTTDGVVVFNQQTLTVDKGMLT